MKRFLRKDILKTLRQLTLSLYGRSADSEILLCHIAGFGYTNPSRTISGNKRVRSRDNALGRRNRRTNHSSRGTSRGCCK